MDTVAIGRTILSRILPMESFLSDVEGPWCHLDCIPSGLSFSLQRVRAINSLSSSCELKCRLSPDSTCSTRPDTRPWWGSASSVYWTRNARRRGREALTRLSSLCTRARVLKDSGEILETFMKSGGTRGLPSRLGATLDSGSRRRTGRRVGVAVSLWAAHSRQTSAFQRIRARSVRTENCHDLRNGQALQSLQEEPLR